MAKTLYFNCDMGAAGDMITAALLDLMPERELAVKALNEMGIPGVEYHLSEGTVFGRRMDVLVNGEEEHVHDHHEHEHSHEHDHDHDHHHEHSHEHDHHHEHEHSHEHDHHHEHEHSHGHEHHHDHDHSHDHHHGHGHHHHSLHDVQHVIEHLNVSEKVKQDARAIFELIAKAEGEVHHKEMDQIHFHEVGTMDAVADVVAASYLMDQISREHVVVSPIHVGSGRVHCAHGIMPVPAPATALILKGVPIYGGEIEGELCTPTGAAILKYYADEFGKMPSMAIESTGYGLGKKEFKVTNCITVYLGETAEPLEKTVEMSVNLDDMTPEEIGYAMEVLFEEGALDVYTTPIGMKKNRQAVKLSCICNQEDEEHLVDIIFKHTSSIGVRTVPLKRHVKERQVMVKKTPYGDVRYKKTYYNGEEKEKPEYDDVRNIAKNQKLSLYEVKKVLEETSW